MLFTCPAMEPPGQSAASVEQAGADALGAGDAVRDLRGVQFAVFAQSGGQDLNLGPGAAQSGAADLSQAFLLLAIAGVGLKTSLKEVTQLGWRPVAMIFSVTLGLALMAGMYLSVVH